MKSSHHANGGNFPTGEIFRKPNPAWLTSALWLFVAPLPLQAADTNILEIQSVNVNGKSLPFQGKEKHQPRLIS